MSLTNEMLKNLQRRHAQDENIKKVMSGLSPAEVRLIHKKYVLYASIILGGCLFLAAFIFLNKSQASELVTAASNSTSVPSSAPPPPAPTVTSPPLQVPVVATTKPVNTESEAIPFDLLTAPTNESIITPVSSSGTQPEAADSKVVVKTTVKPSLEEKIDRAYEYALNLIEENKIKDAMDILQGILQTEPENDEVRITLATLLLQQNQNIEAEKLLMAGLILHPQNLQMTELYARALIDAGQYDKALQALLKVSDQATGNINYNALLAAVYEHLGKPANAIAIYQKLSNQQPYNARWLVGMGVALEEMGNNNAALQAYQKAKAANQLSPELLNFVVARIQALGGMD